MIQAEANDCACGPRRRPVNRAALSVAGLAGLGAVVAVAIWAREPIALLFGRIGPEDAPLLLAALALNAGNLALSVAKLRRLNPDAGAFAPAMAVTTGGSVMGNFMPVQMAVSAARALYARLLGQPPGRAAAHSIHEQVFDALIVFAAALAAPLYLVGGAGAAIPATVAGLVAVTFLMNRVFAFGARIFRSSERISAWLAGAAALPGGTARFLLAASALRFVMTLFRALLILAALGLNGTLGAAAVAYPLIQIAGVLPLTPGGLGVVEAGWTGVLASAGAALPLAAAAAVAMRAAILVFDLITLAVFAALALAWRRR